MVEEMIQKQTCDWSKMRRWLNSVEQLDNCYKLLKEKVSINIAKQQMKKYDGINPDTSLQVYANIGAAIMGGEIITEDTLIDIWTMIIYE